MLVGGRGHDPVLLCVSTRFDAYPRNSCLFEIKIVVGFPNLFRMFGEGGEPTFVYNNNIIVSTLPFRRFSVTAIIVVYRVVSKQFGNALR